MSLHQKFLKKLPAALLFLILINAAACASGQGSEKGNSKTIFKDNGTKNVVKTSNVKKYSEMLVDIKSYSTNGSVYQNKYEKQILSMTGDIIEGQDLDVNKGSVGFYFDKKSARTDRLFLGVDINIVREGTLDYGRFSVKVIKENVGGIVDLMHKYQVILNENEIVGIVIGFKWIENGSSQQVNIWIKKEDLQLFYDGKLTLNDMYQRSTITNTFGKIILLPI